MIPVVTFNKKFVTTTVEINHICSLNSPAMIKFILAIATALLTTLSCCAQDFMGMAVYESKTSTADFSRNIGNNSQITPEMQKVIEERMRKMFEKTFTLYFDKTQSIYEEQEKLDAPGNDQQRGGMRMMSSFMGGGGRHYKNVKSKTFLIEREMMGKEFLIKDSLPKLQWKMTGETKQIGGYTCMKATAVMPAPKTDFRNFKPKSEEDQKKADTKEQPRATNFFNRGELPTEIEVVAWYTPEIPVMHGPENYWGLPGLMLEVSAGKTVILCSKVVINPKERKEIKVPTKGEEVTQAKFDEIMMKKMEEMQQMFQQRGGNTRTMRIGG